MKPLSSIKLERISNKPKYRDADFSGEWHCWSLLNGGQHHHTVSHLISAINSVKPRDARSAERFIDAALETGFIFGLGTFGTFLIFKGGEQ